MKLFLSHSLSPTDLQVASLLARQAQNKGIAVEFSQHQPFVAVNSIEVIQRAILTSDFVIAIVSLDSPYTANVQQELEVATSQGKPCIALVEHGGYSIHHIPGVQYVEFSRRNIGPALTHLSNILEMKKNQGTLNKWVLGGALALFALYLISSSDNK